VEGNITNLVVVKRDLSKEELLQKQLQQAMKLEAIGTLAGGIAHDFNNILAAMIGYGQIAKGKLPEEDPAQEDIDQVLLAGDRASQLVKQILTFSRRDSEGTFHPLKVQHVIKEVIKLLRSSFPTTIEIRQNIDNNCPAILAEPSQLHQVVMNLCTNAKQAIGENYGAVTIGLEEYTVKSPKLIQGSSLLTTGSYVQLTVSDSGQGMSKEIQSRIFDPFFTSKPKDQGTGLGLSVVHGIVERHGGTIMVESVLDEGTTFSLFFPVINEDVEAKKKLTEPYKLGTERIMVVDDEKPIAELLKLMLSGLGYTVSVYTSSLEAVSYFRKHPHDFDAVITDMTMPDMTGAELAREMLSLRPKLPIVMATGYNENIDEEKASRIGIRSFLLKPVKKATMATVLRTVLDNG
jgi:nitrogen-specific signal transduction histidine kinase/CheY-like chemotaxis protein